MFFAMPSPSTGYKLYGNTTPCATIMGNGDINTIGSVAAASAQITNNCSVGGALTSASLQTTGNCTVGGSLSVTGSLTTTSFYAPKPWFANFGYCQRTIVNS